MKLQLWTNSNSKNIIGRKPDTYSFEIKIEKGNVYLYFHSENKGKFLTENEKKTIYSLYELLIMDEKIFIYMANDLYNIIFCLDENKKKFIFLFHIICCKRLPEMEYLIKLLKPSDVHIWEENCDFNNNYPIRVAMKMFYDNLNMENPPLISCLYTAEHSIMEEEIWRF